MNKLLVSSVFAALCLTTHAQEDAADMIFMFKDGSEQSIGAKNLEMTIDDGSLVADNGIVSLVISLSELQKFGFGTASALSSIGCDPSNWTLYDLDGKAVGTFADLSSCGRILPAGIYIAKSASSTIKIAVR